MTNIFAEMQSQREIVLCLKINQKYFEKSLQLSK